MTPKAQHFTLTQEIQIPAVGFGTYLISNEDAPQAIGAAIDAGYRHIDTASGYHNEEAVGAGIRDGLSRNDLSRTDLFVTGKLWPGNPAWGDAPKTAKQVVAECETTLQKLGLDYVDLYLIHAPYGGPERVNQWRAMLDLKSRELARAIGVSNYTEAHLDEIKSARLEMPAVNQIELHPWSQKPELLGYMSEQGIAPVAYSSLVPLASWRSAPGQDSAKTEEMRADSTTFETMAEKYGVTAAQLLLRWGVQNGYAVLPKSLNPDRMRQNLDLFSFKIDPGDMAQIQEMDRGESVAWATGDPSIAD